MLKTGLLKDQWVDNGFDGDVDKPFKDLIEDTEQRDWPIAPWVFFGFRELCDRHYKSSSPDFRFSDVVQAGRAEAT